MFRAGRQGKHLQADVPASKKMATARFPRLVLAMSSLRCLITAGPTREHLDPVRYLSNGSSGKMGYALAAEAQRRGWSVDLVSGPVQIAPPAGVSLTKVVSAAQMLATCEDLFSQCNLFIAVAAVADFRPRSSAAEKLKKTEHSLVLELEPTVDIVKTLAARKTNGQRVMGFAAETHALEESAQRKLLEKNLDWVVANDVSQPGIGMDADDNRVILFTRNGERSAFGPAPKTLVAKFLIDRVAATFSGG